MTLQQLYYFREVVQTGHFTSAAENLYVSQSGLSNAILTLERELGVSLFVRNYGKKSKPTHFAEKLLPYVEKVLASIDEIETLAAQEKDPFCGIVVIAYSFINGHSLIPRVFDGFFSDRKNENIVVNFDVVHKTVPTEELIRLGEVDIGFNGMEKAEGLLSSPFSKQKLYAFIPAAHPLSKCSSISIHDLADEQIISYHPGSELYHLVHRMFENNGYKLNELSCHSDWSEQMAQVAVKAGIAISPLVPVDQELVSVIPLNDPLASRTIYMHVSAERRLPAHVNYVKKYCELFSSEHNLLEK